MNTWCRLTAFICVVCCFGPMTKSQLIDEEMLSYIQFMSYMSSISRDTTSMAMNIPTIVTRMPVIDPALIFRIVKDVLSVLNVASAGPEVASPPPATPPLPDINAASKVPNTQVTQGRGDGDVGVGSPFFPSWFNVHDGTLTI